MVAYQNISTRFKQGLNQLGFAVADAYDDALFLVGDIPEEDYIDIIFHLNNAKTFGADAVYLRKQLNGSYKPQVYLFDKTDESFSEQNEKNIADIQTKLWTSGEVPLACFFYNTNIKILDCTKHITKDYKPEYLVQNLKYTAKADKLYNEQFAVKIKTGIFWDEEVNKDKFKFSNSAYGKLIENIHKVREQLSKVLQGVDAQIISKIIVQSILIKYLEERKSLNKDYFQKYAEENSLADVLRNGKILAFLDVLNDKDTGLNGNVFKWEETEKAKLKGKDLSILAEFLETSKTDVNSTQQELFPDMRYFEFQYIPVELISRLYEEFLGENKAENGLYYTPSHLAKLLVDECLPLKKYQEVDLTKFNALDPACGSGIFLVLVFKRLVQMWKLQNRDKKSNELLPPTIPVLKSLLRNIYGVDKEGEAVNLAAFSLSLALCDELKPKEIID
ncbi:MAG: N-6 DNA methylase, partial [Paludibacter sp.]|nr:N-6 DNA methylase [Paludibacter sp.]